MEWFTDMRYLLDTNTCIAAMRMQALVVQRMSGTSPNDCGISTVTSYELFVGIEKCADPIRERAKVKLLLATVSELPFDESAAGHAANIRRNWNGRVCPSVPTTCFWLARLAPVK